MSASAVYRWVYAIDASARFFIRDINSLRLLIINAAVPVMVLATYELLISLLSTYVDSVIADHGPVLNEGADDVGHNAN